MIIHRALYREASQATLAVLFILLVIFLSLSLTKLMGKVAVGDYSNQTAMALVALHLLGRVDLLLPLSFYIGLIMTMSRWYRDSEMVVLASIGIGVVALLRPVLLLAGGVFLLVAVLSFFLTPMVARGIERIKENIGKYQKISGITPGVFIESGRGRRIFYIEKIDSKKNKLTNIFVRTAEKDGSSVMLAKSGFSTIDKKTGDKFVVLQNGQLYELDKQRQVYKIMKFGSYSIRIEPRGSQFLAKKAAALTSGKIAKSDMLIHRAEWHWRMGKPIMVMVLAIFALVMAHTDARRGRFANLFIAILLYFVYSNLMGLGQSFIKHGRTPDWLGMWWVHILMALLAGYFLWMRHQNKSLLSLPYWRRKRRVV